MSLSAKALIQVCIAPFALIYQVYHGFI